MTIQDPYDVIVTKLREYPNDIPLDTKGNVSEAFHEYRKLLIIPEEAEIVQHLVVKPLGLRELSKRLGKDRTETKEILKDLTEKNIIQDIGGYSHFLKIAQLHLKERSEIPHITKNLQIKYIKKIEQILN